MWTSAQRSTTIPMQGAYDVREEVGSLAAASPLAQSINVKIHKGRPNTHPLG